MLHTVKLTTRIGQQWGIARLFAPSHILLTGSSSRTFTGSNVQGQRERDETVLHRLNNSQKTFLYAHRHRTRFAGSRLSFNSRKPLSDDVVQEALMHLQEKTQVLRTGIKDYNGEKWFHKLSNEKMDLKVLGKGTSEQEALDYCMSGFDEVHGPSWKSCLVHLPEDAPCLDLEAKKDYPHQYNLYTFTHHSMVDGVTMITFFQPLTDMINDIIEGNKIDNSLLSVFVSNDEYEEAYLRIKESLTSDSSRMEKLKDEILKSDQLPLFSKRFPRLEVTNPSTKFKSMNINQDAMIKFIDKCKDINITGNTGLQMVVNTALVQLAQEAGLNDDSYTLGTHYTIDLRRYMKPRDLPIHGCHIEGAVSMTTVDKHVTQNFWKNCHNLNNVNVDMVKKGTAVNQAIGRQLFLSQPAPEDFFKNPPKLTRDFGLNNLRSLDRVVHGRGKHLQITDIKGFTCAHYFNFPFLVTAYDYRGVYKQILSYGTEWMTEDDSNALVSKISSLVEYFSCYD